MSLLIDQDEEGQMLSKEDFVTIQALVKRGVYLCDIARELGVHPKTVRRALQRGDAPPRKRAFLIPTCPSSTASSARACGMRS